MANNGNCTNCGLARTSSQDPKCVSCLKNSTRENPFPGWEPQKNRGNSTGYSVASLLNTSVDDCKITVQHITDIDLLRETLESCQSSGHKTRAQIIWRRIRQLEVA